MEWIKREESRTTLPGVDFSKENFSKYVAQPGLDIGFRGGNTAGGSGEPAFQFTGIDLLSPNYDGLHLPYPDEKFMTVHSSHVLEHIEFPEVAIQEWFRVVSVGGHLIITVPHQYLYEKTLMLPSRFNFFHKSLFTPGSLLLMIERFLKPNTYRVIYVRDNDTNFNYDLGPHKHSTGCYEIECVIRKITPPSWGLE